MKVRRFLLLGALVCGFGTYGCGEPEEAQRFELPVLVDGDSLEEFETNRGYQIDLEEVLFRVERVEFTVGGEAHGEASLLPRLRQMVIGEAYAHPNHSAGGEVAGEIVGPFDLHWLLGEMTEIEVGTFLEGNYGGYNLFLTVADGYSEVAEGMTGRISGTASKNGEQIPFEVALVGQNTEIYGGALSGNLPDEAVTAVALEFLAYEPHSSWSIFDRVEFSELSQDQDGVVRIESGSLAYARIQTALASHEHYGGRFVTGE